MALPSHVKYVVIGAGIHGMSTAWHLAEGLRRSGRGDGRDVLVIEKRHRYRSIGDQRRAGSFATITSNRRCDV